MHHEAAASFARNFFKRAESYLIRPKPKPKKKPAPAEDSEFDAIAKQACAEVFAATARQQLVEKLARYSHVPKLLNPEGDK